MFRTYLYVFAVFMGMTILSVSAGSSTDSTIDFASFTSTVDLPYAMSDMTAVTVPESFFITNDGPRIYLMGGCISDQSCAYADDPSKGIACYCTEITDKVIYFTPETNKYHTDVAPMPVARFRHVAAREGNYIYVAGGRNVDELVLKDIYRYDVVADIWEFVVSWENATSDGVAFTTPQNDYLYLVSGYSQNYSIVAEMEVFDTSSSIFLPSGTAPPMKYPRGDTQIASLYDTQFYVIGGWSIIDDDSFCHPSKIVEYYDSAQNQWFTTTDMNFGRGDLASGVLDNMIFAVGGEQKSPSDVTCTYSVPVKDVERYVRRANNTWITEESIPDDIFRFVGATYNTSNSLYSSAIYLFGGQGTFDANRLVFPVRNSTLVYYPEAIYGSRRKKDLDAAGIAGIVVAGVVVLACIILGIISGLVYRYTYYRYKPLDEIDISPDPAIGGGSRFPTPVMSGGSKFSSTAEKDGNIGMNSMTANHRNVLSHPSDHDLEIMEMQESFPDHMTGSKSSHERSVAKTNDSHGKF